LEGATLAVAAISVLISVVAAILSYYAFKRTLHESIRPVLIFSRGAGALWRVQNVGTGPAVRLVVADRDTSGEWQSAVTCYPLSAGGSSELPWIRHGTALVAEYCAVDGAVFTTVFEGGTNRVLAGRIYKDMPSPDEEWFARVASEEGIEGALTEEDLAGKSVWELDVIRNEIYARHGYSFRREDLREHFSKAPWYTPMQTNQFRVSGQFTPTEKYNVEFVRRFQIRHSLMRPR
jgi:hypothetical protein